LAHGLNVALVKWNTHDELAEALAAELVRAGYRPQFFMYDAAIPSGVDKVLTFAPYGKFLPIARQVGMFPPHARPFLAHWNFEGVPNQRWPWAFVYLLSVLRSRFDNLPWLGRRMFRFRYMGDYFFAYRQGWLKLLASVSPVIARLHSAHGLPAQLIPWGTSPDWFADMQLDRDIDVLWMGKRRNARRGHWIDSVRADLEKHGVRFYMADNIEHPFIFGSERTGILNRAKITLNVKTSAQSNGFTFRFHMAAGNRSLVVSEAFVPQPSYYRAGEHFVWAPPEQLAATILYYLEHDGERRALAENAFQLVTTEMTLQNSVGALMRHVEHVRQTT
jgi:hypothetical protein